MGRAAACRKATASTGIMNPNEQGPRARPNTRPSPKAPAAPRPCRRFFTPHGQLRQPDDPKEPKTNRPKHGSRYILQRSHIAQHPPEGRGDASHSRDRHQDTKRKRQGQEECAFRRHQSFPVHISDRKRDAGSMAGRKNHRTDAPQKSGPDRDGNRALEPPCDGGEHSRDQVHLTPFDLRTATSCSLGKNPSCRKYSTPFASRNTCVGITRMPNCLTYGFPSSVHTS